ncbi:ATP binding protein [Penicillium odoratum]|uniref:ATP binding protein n=1 Tax=Penicillium odoratum TaxID=1167516 RepID=UPI0025465E81|nr:ATP binding protein [Penicillium odoratum]KAJ5745331.1 ATP binding protein [Penicillium odoratum]
MDSLSEMPLIDCSIQEHLAGSETTPSTSHQWISKPEVPSGDEIMGIDGTESGDDVILPSNRPFGPWPSATEYLRTHYELLREDAIAPLRDAVTDLRDGPNMKDTKKVSVYEKVHIVRVTAAPRGIAFRIRFSTKRAGKKIMWDHSSRLMAGSLVALSPARDSFSTKCAVATVAARPLDNVNKYPPEIDIYFARPKDIDIDFQQEWVMVEAKDSYFEASRYTLTALQKMAKESFSLGQYICHLDPNVAMADHVVRNPLMDLQSLAGVSIGERSVYNIFDDLPTAPMGSLNTIQWQALKEILTKRIALIQGPPGTGKTHVSVAALQIFLSNMVKRDPPIVIAAHTNHAVDQLLTLVSKSEQNYIRLGGRSSDADIVAKSLYAIRMSGPLPKFNKVFKNSRKELDRLASEILDLFDPLKEETSGTPISASSFLEYGLLTSDQVESLEHALNLLTGWNDKGEDDPITHWLEGQMSPFWVKYGEEHARSIEDDNDQVYEAMQESETGDREFLNGRYVAFETKFCGRDNTSVSEKVIHDHLQNPDLGKIEAKLRGRIYNHLRGELIKILNEKVRELAIKYQEASNIFAMTRQEVDTEILRAAKLVAMTTTGLSKYRALVASVNPKIVLIEEAAEVLEGPITAACLESVQQLILVGDHKQLKGHCSLNDLAGPPFHLDMSMFERLIGNNMPYVMLREQRRMIPEIRELLHPIYGELHDHPSVLEYPLIPGMGNIRSFFFTHGWPEQGDSLFSKLNEMEAAMIVELYVYLVMNGTPGRKITILTFYNGQRKLLYKLMRSHKHSALIMPVNVVTVDSYQGEENDIVLVSLVRSNSSQSIGFLGVDNRVCVALSRAKRGYFLFGNSALLASNSPLWKKVLDIMAANERVGTAFKLTCKSHGRSIDISVPGDWKDTNGGCQQDCGETLECGRLCPMACHRSSHRTVICTAKCSHVQPCCRVVCGRLCKEVHSHHCDCAEHAVVVERTKDEEIDDIQKVIDGIEKAAIDGEFSRPPHTLVKQGRISAKQTMRSILYSRGSKLNRPKDSRKGLRELPTPTDEPRDIEGRLKWQAFAQGGAKEVDGYIDTLNRATDATTDVVRNAIANLDKSFIPRVFLPIKLSQELQKQEDLKKESQGAEEPLAEEFQAELQKSQDHKEREKVVPKPQTPYVAEGHLLDLD